MIRRNTSKAAQWKIKQVDKNTLGERYVDITVGIPNRYMQINLCDSPSEFEFDGESIID